MNGKATLLLEGIGSRQIYETLKDQILGGAFGSAGPLPSSRALAQELGVSRTTVTVAYEQLVTEGFIEVRQGARPRVAAAVVRFDARTKVIKPADALCLSSYGERVQRLPARGPRAGAGLVVDFQYGDLAQADFPTGMWKRAMNAAMAEQQERLAYEDPQGSYRLRVALQGYLWRARALRCDVEQIIVVNGSQQGLDLCARLLLDPGDRFVIENPCYAMARSVFASTGASPVSLPADDGGLDTDLLAGLNARLAYVTPSHQFPLGGVLPVARRHKLLEWARRQDAYVVEDDYDSEYRYDINPVLPLHGLGDSDKVIYLGTISKTLSPTLRIGYLVVPAGLEAVFASAKQLTDRHSPIAEQVALASLIEGGSYESHVRRMRRLNRERRETLLNALRHRFGDHIAIAGADAGLHIVAWFNGVPRSREAEFLENARRVGVGLHSVSSLYDPKANDVVPDKVGVVMGYAALETRQIERGVHLLADVVEQFAQADE